MLKTLLFLLQFLILLCPALSVAQTPGPELYVESGFTTGLSGAAVSHDGRLLASFDWQDGTSIKLWDLTTGTELQTINIPEGGIRAAAFSRDSKLLATGHLSGAIKFWDLSSGEERLIDSLNFAGFLSYNHLSITSLAFSPDGTKLASGHVDNAIRVWGLSSLEFNTLDIKDGERASFTFTLDGKRLVSFGGGEAKVWEMTTVFGSSAVNPLLKSCPVRLGSGAQADEYAYAHALNRSGDRLAIGGSSGTLTLWDVGTCRELRTITGQAKNVNSLAYSPDGKTVAVFDAQQDKSFIRLLDADGGAVKSTLDDWASFVTFTADGRLVSGSGSTVKVRDANGTELLKLGRRSSRVNSVAFSPDGKHVAVGSRSNATHLWDLTSGANRFELVRNENLQGDRFADESRSVAFSPDGQTLAVADAGIQLWDVATGRRLEWLAAPTMLQHFTALTFSPDGKTLAGVNMPGGENGLVLWDMTRKVRDQWEGVTHPYRRLLTHERVQTIAFGPDNRTLASGSVDGTIKLWDLTTGQATHTFTAHDWPGLRAGVLSVGYSNDGTLLVSAGADGIIKLWDVGTGEELRSYTRQGHTGAVTAVAFSPAGSVFVSAGVDGTLKFWNPNLSFPVKTLNGHGGAVTSLAFSHDGELLLTGSNDGTARIWQVEMARELIRLINTDRTNWIVVSPEGRFDTNAYLAELKGAHWRLPGEPLSVLPLEIFMRDYYEPRLLPRILAGEEFKHVRASSSLNFQQPGVRILEVKRQGKTDAVTVTVEVRSTSGEVARGRERVARTSGVYDLRLFRNGRLVGYEPAAGGPVEVNAKTHTATITFRNVALPHNEESGAVEFSAYAFNSDGVKSATARATHDVKGLTPRKGRAYLITVGVNAYDNPALNLNYAVNDAREVRRVMGASLESLVKGGEYTEVVEVPLLSFDDTSGGIPVAARDATKQKVLGVLDLLAGKDVGETLRQSIPNARRLQKTTPDDLVIIWFSSHGYADANGQFYILLSDIGRGGKGVTREVLGRAISSDELSLRLRDVDSGEMVMVVDACHAAAAVEGKEFKPGPMGARGLGQLSYDKGMRILAATQAANIALESGAIRQGLLTYALVRDGLEGGAADFRARDGAIMLKEWLEFGVTRVPELYALIRQGKIKAVGRDIEMAGTEGATPSASYQQPLLFDFARKRRELILAGSVGAAPGR